MQAGGNWVLGVFAISVASVVTARMVRERAYRRRGVCHITLPGGRKIEAPIGRTLLEAIQMARIPHASVCGGRGTHDANVKGGVGGREQAVVVMFLDLRGSTGLAETRMPYDVLYLLNQFFAEMSAALDETRGHYAQFSGDGLMALYGTEGSLQDGARDALRGARRMHERLGALNKRLQEELDQPLRMGIGLHAGDAIVGTMGPPNAPNFSAIGDNVNVAARLESLTKETSAALIISSITAHASGMDFSEFTEEAVAIKGRDDAVNIYRIGDASRIPVKHPETAARLPVT